MLLDYDRSSSKEKWTIMQYLRNFDLMTAFAYALRSAPKELTEENLLEVMGKLEAEGIYHPTSKKPIKTNQQAEKNINTAYFRSAQIAWYMFGYYDKNVEKGVKKKFVFSPLGNLLLDNIHDKSKSSKIFLTMLISLAFRQQFSMMNRKFNIYPYRLVFKLLTDERIGGYIFSDEATYLVMFLKSINASDYEKLVSDILEMRSKTTQEKYELFKKNEGVMALALQEWKYFCGMLQSANIIGWEIPKEAVGNLAQGVDTKRHAKKPTMRAYKMDKIYILPENLSYVKILVEKYPFDVQP